MKKIDIVILSLVQHLSRTVLRSLKIDNFYQAYIILLFGVVGIGMVSIINSHIAIFEKYPNAPVFDVVLQAIAFIVLYTIMLIFALRIIFVPWAATLKARATKLIQEGLPNYLVNELRGVRFISWCFVVYAFAVPLYSSEPIDWVLLSIAGTFTLSVHLLSVRALMIVLEKENPSS